MENAGKSTALAEALHSTEAGEKHALKHRHSDHGHSLRLIATNIGAEKKRLAALLQQAKGCHSAQA